MSYNTHNYRFTKLKSDTVDISVKAAEKKSNKRFIQNLLWDFVALFSAVIPLSLVKYGNNFEQHFRFYITITVYLLILLIVSFCFKKYEHKEKVGFYRAIDKHFKSWLITTVIVISAIYYFEIETLKIKWLLVGYCGFFIFEVILLTLRYSFRRSVNMELLREEKHREVINAGIEAEDEISESLVQTPVIGLNHIYNNEIKELIEKHSNKEQPRRLLLFTYSMYNILPYLDKSFDQIINLSKINRIRFINKFHEAANIKLCKNGLYIVCAETLGQRKKRIFKKYSAILGLGIWIMDFFMHRVCPKIPYIRKIYYLLWNHWNKPISYAESLGRLYSCGFELVEEKIIENKHWFVMRKVNAPMFDYKATYGLLIRLKRVGKGGKPINVYKFRTMHPFSEFLQELVMQRNSLAEGGKFKNDFRVSTWGRFLRRTWLDELPMIINFIMGDLKLVGVRPLSKHYLSLYPEEFQTKRAAVKPGLVPPFYADMPKTLEEIIASENKYIDAFLKHRFATDWKYFWKAFWNIVFKMKRSR